MCDQVGFESDSAIGTRMRHRRWMLGLPRQSLADRTGIGLARIEMLEGGVHPFLAEELAHMAKALEVSVAYFFASEDATDPAS